MPRGAREELQLPQFFLLRHITTEQKAWHHRCKGHSERRPQTLKSHFMAMREPCRANESARHVGSFALDRARTESRSSSRNAAVLLRFRMLYSSGTELCSLEVDNPSGSPLGFRQLGVHRGLRVHEVASNGGQSFDETLSQSCCWVDCLSTKDPSCWGRARRAGGAPPGSGGTGPPAAR